MSSPPLVQITGGRLVCPVCRALDTIAEEDHEVRLVLHAWLGERSDFPCAQHDCRFFCQACLATVAVPPDLVDGIRYHV